MVDDPFKDRLGDHLRRIEASDVDQRRLLRDLEEEVAKRREYLNSALGARPLTSAVEVVWLNAQGKLLANAANQTALQQAIAYGKNNAASKVLQDQRALETAGTFAAGQLAATTLKQLVGDYGGIASLAASQELSQISKAWAGHRTASEAFAQYAKGSEQLAKYAASATAFGDLGAHQRLVNSFAAPLAHVVEPWTKAGANDAQSAWQERLSTQMRALSEPWMLPHDPGRSLLGYAHLSRMAEALRSAPPYSREMGRLFEEELGELSHSDDDASPEERDQAAIDAGMRPELIAFPPPAYPLVIQSVGLVLTLPPLPVPKPIEGSNPGASFDPAHKVVLTHVSIHLRKRVEQELEKLSGSDWARHRVHADVLKRWKGQQATARARGWSVYPLIHYADLGELCEVICRTDNWKAAFEAIFGHKDHFRVSMERLIPLRNDNAHERPIGRAQTLGLVIEAHRILLALGVDILDGKEG